MSAVKLELELERAAQSAENLVADIFRGALSGHVAPAHVVGDEARESNVLLDVEDYLPELFATTFSGAPIIWSVGQQAAGLAGSEKIKVWCAVQAGFPVGGEPAFAPYLRFVVPDMGGGERIERLLPIAVLELSARAVVLEFAAGGAPFVAPPSVDHGGPIDQAWARSAEASRAWLDHALLELERIDGVRVRLSAPWRLAATRDP